MDYKKIRLAITAAGVSIGVTRRAAVLARASGPPARAAEIFPREQQTPEALGALVKADAEKWWPIIKESGIKAE